MDTHDEEVEKKYVRQTKKNVISGATFASSGLQCGLSWWGYLSFICREVRDSLKIKNHRQTTMVPACNPNYPTD